MKQLKSFHSRPKQIPERKKKRKNEKNFKREFLRVKSLSVLRKRGTKRKRKFWLKKDKRIS